MKTGTDAVVVIYHANCPDGFAAALAAHLFFKAHSDDQAAKDNITYHKGHHGKAPPDCSGKQVYILDFSYKKEHMLQLCQQARKVTLIDHHISAMSELQGLDQQCPELELHFDMQQSGAVLAWKYFHQHAPPKLFEHIQDNDLWQFNIPHTREIISAILSYPMSFQLWEKWLNNDHSLSQLHTEGSILNRQRDGQIQKYKNRARSGKIAGYNVPVVNAPSSICSELLHQLSEGYAFAASYEDRPDKRIWQLRSGGEKAVDVAKIAQLFGGGGHKNASGFSTPNFKIDINPSANTHAGAET